MTFLIDAMHLFQIWSHHDHVTPLIGGGGTPTKFKINRVHHVKRHEIGTFLLTLISEKVEVPEPPNFA